MLYNVVVVSSYRKMNWLYVYIYSFFFDFDSVTQMVKNLPVVQKTHQSLGQEDHLEKGMVWRIPWTEKPHGLQSMGSQRVGYDWLTNTHTYSDHSRTLFGTQFLTLVFMVAENISKNHSRHLQFFSSQMIPEVRIISNSAIATKQVSVKVGVVLLPALVIMLL